ncbi:putative LRR receptor-like serine/threonine-protein kinase [Platanthera guangdongensis]|uniref:LRR receptor-like serine/threonine-protein kinase n=1 Tax=Platanthera guangdongensis TaxID=2320717 RepID=A0ABR2M9N3_9ASPA
MCLRAFAVENVVSMTVGIDNTLKCCIIPPFGKREPLRPLLPPLTSISEGFPWSSPFHRLSKAPFWVLARLHSLNGSKVSNNTICDCLILIARLHSFNGSNRSAPVWAYLEVAGEVAGGEDDDDGGEYCVARIAPVYVGIAWDLWKVGGEWKGEGAHDPEVPRAPVTVEHLWWTSTMFEGPNKLEIAHFWTHLESSSLNVLPYTSSPSRGIPVSGLWDLPLANVFNTALTSDGDNNMELQWPPISLPTSSYYVALYFVDMSKGNSRTFDVFINGYIFYHNLEVTSSGLVVFANNWNLSGITRITLQSSLDIRSASNYLRRRVIALESLKKSINKVPLNWDGDPCMPHEYAWFGITCSAALMDRKSALSPCYAFFSAVFGESATRTCCLKCERHDAATSSLLLQPPTVFRTCAHDRKKSPQSLLLADYHLISVVAPSPERI